MTRNTFIALLGAAFVLSAPAASEAKDFPKGSPKFEKRYKAALAEAKKEGKPVIVVFSASWCGPCQTMKNNVYPSDAVKPYHDKFVWAYLDTDENANKKPAKDQGVSGIPHIAFLDADGKSVDKQVGGNSPEAFAKKLEEVLKKAAPADGTKKEDKAEDKPAEKKA